MHLPPLCIPLYSKETCNIYFFALYIKKPVICQCAENTPTSFISYLDIVCIHLLFVLLHVHCKLWGWASVLYVQHLLQWVQVNSCASGNAVKQNNEQVCVCVCQTSPCRCECAVLRNVAGWVKYRRPTKLFYLALFLIIWEANFISLV